MKKDDNDKSVGGTFREAHDARENGPKEPQFGSKQVEDDEHAPKPYPTPEFGGAPVDADTHWSGTAKDAVRANDFNRETKRAFLERMEKEREEEETDRKPGPERGKE